MGIGDWTPPMNLDYSANHTYLEVNPTEHKRTDFAANTHRIGLLLHTELCRETYIKKVVHKESQGAILTWARMGSLWACAVSRARWSHLDPPWGKGTFEPK